MKYLEDNFGCSYNLPINIVKVHIFPVDSSEWKIHLTPSRSISFYLYSNFFIGSALHIAILPACQRNTLRRFWVSEKVFYWQIRWLWFQHDINRSFSPSNHSENFKRSLRIDFFFAPHAAPILFHQKKTSRPSLLLRPQDKTNQKIAQSPR